MWPPCFDWFFGSCFGSQAGLLAFEALQGLPRPARGTHGRSYCGRSRLFEDVNMWQAPVSQKPPFMVEDLTQDEVDDNDVMGDSPEGDEVSGSDLECSVPELGDGRLRLEHECRGRGGALGGGLTAALGGLAFSCPAPLCQAAGGCPSLHLWVGVGRTSSRGWLLLPGTSLQAAPAVAIDCGASRAGSCLPSSSTSGGGGRPSPHPGPAVAGLLCSAVIGCC